MADQNVDTGDLAHKAEALRGTGATALIMAGDGKLAGVIGIADPIKANTRAALDGLRANGIRIVANALRVRTVRL